MTTYVPRMNRVFTLTASAISTTEALIPWRYGHYGAEADGPLTTPVTSLPSVGKYAWSASLLGSHAFDDVDTANKIVAATITELELGRNSVNEDGSPNTALPPPGEILRDDDTDTLTGKEVRFGPASLYPDSYVKFTAGGRSDYFTTDSRYLEFFFITVDGSISKVGSNWTLEPDTDIIVTVQDQTADVSVATPSSYTVWGELREFGIQQNITTSGTVFTTGREQTATLTIRYNPKYLVGEKVVDDLDREWRVTSSRPIGDRRFIQYDLALDVV